MRALSTEHHPTAAMPNDGAVGFDCAIADHLTGVSEDPRGDAPMERSGGVGAALERPPISVWREDASIRVKSTRDWLLSGEVADGVVQFALHVQPAAKLLLHQLAMSGSVGEITQEH